MNHTRSAWYAIKYYWYYLYCNNTHEILDLSFEKEVDSEWSET